MQHFAQFFAVFIAFFLSCEPITYRNFAHQTFETVQNLDKKSQSDSILIQGARQHNLKNITVEIPRNKFVVITGLSGSGKSSLAFDTLYAEGQRRYVESLSSYARQFFGRMVKPEVDFIKGIAPAIAIEQKVNTVNSRSTVGTSSEVYEYLKLLFARIGKTYSPISGELVKRDTVTDVVDFIINLPQSTKVSVLAPLPPNSDRSFEEKLTVLLQQGFTRLSINGEIIRIEDQLKRINEIKDPHLSVFILIDRIVTNREDEELLSRVGDSVQTAFYEGAGDCKVEWFEEDNWLNREFNNRFEADGIIFEEPTVNLFAFNNPYGACKRCEGFGTIIGISEDLVIPDKTRSIYEEAVACWKGEKLSEYLTDFIVEATKKGFRIHKPYIELSEKELNLLWNGDEEVPGIKQFFDMVEENLYKIQYRVLLSRYRGKTTCPDCNGTRLRADAAYVKIDDHSIHQLVTMPLDKLLQFFQNINLSDQEEKIGRRLLTEIRTRLKVMNDVGLHYLNLNRLSNSLSGGESQRLNLSTALGSSLVGSMYILDEPSIGLHPRDTLRLITVLKQLRDLGNSVIVVEHDEEIIKTADHIIDIGPDAGSNGGRLVFQGSLKDLLKSNEGYTGQYLSGKRTITTPKYRRSWKEFIQVIGAAEHNLKNIDVKFPLHTLVAVTGVSGSGKTTLVKRILYPALKNLLGGSSEKPGRHKAISGDIKRIEDIELVDQNPIGRSSRSNPATYVGVWDEVRALYAAQPLAAQRNYKPGFFSFNVEGGRCETCEGEGVVHIEMQFMADLTLTCESCKGKRFKEETLDVKFEGVNVGQLLDMTIDEAVDFFTKHASTNSSCKKIITRLKPLQDVGLGYLKVGQPSSTLSGGEAQRVKLAFFLSKGQSDKTTLFIFDEPTTGLHIHDISKLMASFNALIEKGHSVIVIEHNTEVIKSADWIIDLGPEGGLEGGNIVFEGKPEDIVNCKESFTGMFLKEILGKK